MGECTGGATLVGSGTDQGDREVAECDGDLRRHRTDARFLLPATERRFLAQEQQFSSFSVLCCYFFLNPQPRRKVDTRCGAEPLSAEDSSNGVLFCRFRRLHCRANNNRPELHELRRAAVMLELVQVVVLHSLVTQPKRERSQSQ